MAKSLKPVEKNNLIQAVIIADTFNDEFLPISNDIPLSLMPMANSPLIGYTLEFLSLGGVQEVFVFCCNHVSEIKSFISTCVENVVGWSVNLKVHVIESDKCRSLGDCLRDLDAKGVLNAEFVLIEPGVIANYNLKLLLEQHRETCKLDSSAAMTLIFEEYATEHRKVCPQDELVIALDENNKVLFHKKLAYSDDKYIRFPISIFSNSEVSIRYDLKDVHIAICSASVLPLFADNFDFQSKDDFIKGLLMNDEIMEGSIYSYISKGDQFGSAAFTWRTYQSVGMELLDNWFYPITPNTLRGKSIRKICQKPSFIALKSKVSEENVTNSIIGSDVNAWGKVTIENSIIFDNVTIENGVVISSSVIGPNCTIKKGAKITAGSILGKGVTIDKELVVENSLVQANQPLNSVPEDQLGPAAFILRIPETLDNEKIIKKMSRLYIVGESDESDSYHYDSSSESEETVSSAHSLPEDTKLFFSEVLDSLSRGFEDKLPCDNLILEINSSRYAYNVTVKEVNFNVMKAILTLSLNDSESEPKSALELSRFLSYFAPIFKNYIKDENAMIDCLHALQEVFTSHNNLKCSWTVCVAKFLYDKEHVNEDAILKWYDSLEETDPLHGQLKTFVKWLQEAEEESSDDETDD